MAKKILLIDDDRNLTEFVKLGLEDTEKFEVVIVNNPLNALAVIKSERPRVVIADLNMPGKFGSDVIAEMKDDPDISSIPVIFMTANVTAEEVAISEGVMGGFPIIAKPAKIDDIVTSIEKQIGPC